MTTDLATGHTTPWSWMSATVRRPRPSPQVSAMRGPPTGSTRFRAPQAGSCGMAGITGNCSQARRPGPGNHRGSGRRRRWWPFGKARHDLPSVS